MDHFQGVPIIDTRDSDVLYPRDCGRGYIPRDYSVYPEAMYQQPSEMEVIDESEWDARYDEQQAQGSSLEHLFLPGGQPAFVNLDQDGAGYCWAYSVGHCIMMDRLKSNQTTVRINPHAVAAVIKRGADQGGWCGLSQVAYKDQGCPLEGTGPGQWPLHSRDLRYDTPEMREKAKAHRCVEDWVDLTKQVHDRNLTRKQMATALFNNQPTAIDVMDWGHSICAIRWVRVEKGRWLPLILNSWKGWGRYGLALLEANMADSIMGAVSIRSSVVSPV